MSINELHPSDILEHHRYKYLHSKGLLPEDQTIPFFNNGLSLRRIKKYYNSEAGNLRRNSNNSMYNNLLDRNVKSNTIVKEENVTLYHCPYSNCNHTARNEKQVKLHVSWKHIPKAKKEEWKLLKSKTKRIPGQQMVYNHLVRDESMGIVV